MGVNTDYSYKDFSKAIRQLLYRKELLEKLKSLDTQGVAIKQLRITEEMVTDILNIMQEVDNKITDSTPQTNKSKSQEPDTDKKFLLESFGQLRSAYKISLSMSIVIFIIGVSFLAIAAVQSFVNPQDVASTSIIGGIGIVQIVALFYRNPLMHIARAVSNAQQAKIAVMSYLIGVSLINQQVGIEKPSSEQMDELIKLTETALGQLQKYTEKDNEKGTNIQ